MSDYRRTSEHTYIGPDGIERQGDPPDAPRPPGPVDGQLYQYHAYARCDGCRTWWRRLVECRYRVDPERLDFLGAPMVHGEHVRDLGGWEKAPDAGSSFALWINAEDGARGGCPTCSQTTAQTALDFDALAAAVEADETPGECADCGAPADHTVTEELLLGATRERLYCDACLPPDDDDQAPDVEPVEDDDQPVELRPDGLTLNGYANTKHGRYAQREWDAGWRTYHGDGHGVRHFCEDGHSWVEQPDGGVSPSWGYGLSSIRYDQPADHCPEPQRGFSRYDDGGPDHGYQCPTCGEVHYCGGCGMGVRCGLPPEGAPVCRPPDPACGKPAVRTLHWRTGNARHGISAGWFDPNEAYEPQPGEQMALV